MDNLLDSRRSRMILLTLCLCLCSLIICELIDPLIARNNNWDLTVQGGFLQQSHLEEHDDDFVLMEQYTRHSVAAIILENTSSQILVASYSLSPLLPPPKAA